jgi:uncharacterized OsmC-like protein
MITLQHYLAFKREQIEILRQQLREASAAPVALQATARVAGGAGVRPVRVREFTVVTDSGPALAGYNLGPTAPELLLSALASCLAHTFLIVAAMKEIELEALEVDVRASIDFRGVLEVDPEVGVAPHGLTYEARVTSPADAATLAALQADVERLCPVLAAVRYPVMISGTVVPTAC